MAWAISMLMRVCTGRAFVRPCRLERSVVHGCGDSTRNCKRSFCRRFRLAAPRFQTMSMRMVSGGSSSWSIASTAGPASLVRPVEPRFDEALLAAAAPIAARSVRLSYPASSIAYGFVPCFLSRRIPDLFHQPTTRPARVYGITAFSHSRIQKTEDFKRKICLTCSFI
jgi:hypothetical protein